MQMHLRKTSGCRVSRLWRLNWIMSFLQLRSVVLFFVFKAFLIPTLVQCFAVLVCLDDDEALGKTCLMNVKQIFMKALTQSNMHYLFLHITLVKMIKCIVFLSLILNVQFVITISRLTALLQFFFFFFCVVAILCLFI